MGLSTFEHVWNPVTSSWDKSTGSRQTLTTPVTTAVTAGTSVAVAVQVPFTVTAIPAGGGSINIETTASGATAVDGGTAVWVAWRYGAVTSTTRDCYFMEPLTHVRGTAATATGSFEVLY